MVPRRELGMTLVEMLIVLAIMGVVSGAVLIGMGGIGRNDRAEAEARRLAGRIALAADAAMVDDRAIGFRWDSTGYGFVGAASRVDPDLDARHALAAGMTLTVEHATSPLDLVADGTGIPVRATIDDGRAPWTVEFDGIDVTTSAVNGG